MKRPDPQMLLLCGHIPHHAAWALHSAESPHEQHPSNTRCLRRQSRYIHVRTHAKRAGRWLGGGNWTHRDRNSEHSFSSKKQIAHRPEHPTGTAFMQDLPLLWASCQKSGKTQVWAPHEGGPAARWHICARWFMAGSGCSFCCCCKPVLPLGLGAQGTRETKSQQLVRKGPKTSSPLLELLRML